MNPANGLIITGMHRSGTSLTAQIFFRAGVYLGDHLLEPSQFNPDGYFEDIDIIELHEEFLRQNSLPKWHNPALFRTKLRVTEDAMAKALALVRDKYDGQKYWGWKDPRTTLFLSFWEELLPNARFVLSYRRPEEVVWSLVRRKGFSYYIQSKVKQALLAFRLWRHFNEKIIQFVKLHPSSALLIKIPDDLQSPEVRDSIARIVSQSWEIDLDDLPEHLANSYKPSLIHQTVPAWITLIGKLYQPTLRALDRIHADLLEDHDKVETLPGSETIRKASRKPDRRICIITPNKDIYSETFIQTHIDRLPVEVKVLYGGTFPSFRDNGKPLVSPNLPTRLTHGFLRRLLRLPFDYYDRKALEGYLIKEKIDGVLAEYGPTGTAVMDVCKRANIPLIVHFHGHDAYEEKILSRFEPRYQELFRTAEAIVAVSRDMKEEILRMGAPEEKVSLNIYGVDTALFKGGDPLHAPPVFTAVGRFVDKKAPVLTLLAFKRVLENCPDARLVMAGDGPLWESCKQLARAICISRSIDFLGSRPQVEVARLLRDSRAFVQHSLRVSYGDSEGTPLAVIEASSTGIPVVSTRHAGIKDVVVEGLTGFLVDEGDVEGMADRMIALAKDPSLAAKMGKAGRERVINKFNVEKSIDNLWQIIEMAICKSK